MAVLMFVITLGSRVAGFVREMVYADVYGTGYIMDAYVLSQSIPLIVAGAFLDPIGVAYMPVFSEVFEKEGKEASYKFTNKIITMILFICSIVISLEILLSQKIVAVFAPKFTLEAKDLTAFYLSVTLTCTIFTCLSSIMIAFLQYNKRFLATTLLGYILDIAVILAAIISKRTVPQVLVLGLFGGGMLKMIFLFVIAKTEGYSYKLSFKLDDYVKRVFSLAIPVFLSSSLGQINAFVDKTLAAGLDEGSVSALSYGYMFCGLIPALTTSIIGVLLYPEINRAANKEDYERFNLLTQKSITVSLMIAIPASLGVLAFSREIIQSIYQHGSFTAESTELTSAALFFYGLGMIFTSMRGLLVQILYSLKGMKYGTFSSMISIAVNISLDLLLVKYMGHRGLALATSIAAATTCVCVVLFIRKHFPMISVAPKAKKIGVVSFVSLMSVFSSRLLGNAMLSMGCLVIFCLAISVVVAVLLFYAGMKLFKIEEINLINDILKIKKTTGERL